MVKAKYQSVLDLGAKLNMKDGDVQVNGDQLQIKGTAATPYEKDLLWNEIKKVGGENPTDLMADISVADGSVYARHTVQSGESLSLIAKHYFKDPMKYKQIFAANTGLLSSPDVIHPGQELVIPNM